MKKKIDEKKKKNKEKEVLKTRIEVSRFMGIST